MQKEASSFNNWIYLSKYRRFVNSCECYFKLAGLASRNIMLLDLLLI